MQNEDLKATKPLISFTPLNDYYYEGQKLYARKKFEIFENDIKCIVGCNGAGKSTLFEQVKDTLRQEHWKDISDLINPFNRIFKDETKTSGVILMFDRDFEAVEGLDEQQFFENFMANKSQSTGEGLMYRFGKAVSLFGKYTNLARKLDVPMIVLADDCDVGTSIDTQDEIVDFIRFLDSSLTEQNIKHAILLSANAYELCHTFDCIDCNTLKQCTFDKYDDYKAFVLKSRGRKNKRNGIDK